MTMADRFGVAQSSMKALASGSEAMWAATLMLWARIRARMASMALTELVTCTTLVPPRSRLRTEKEARGF